MIDNLVQSGFDVSGAAWVKPTEKDRWVLYIVSKNVTDGDLSAAYRAIHAVLMGMPELWITDILAAGQKSHGRRVTRGRSHQLGNMEVDDAFIYSRQIQLAP